MSNKAKFVLILIFFIGAAVRLTDVLRPINHASWRECDLGAISRNYVNESMNPFYPRVDWRGQTKGFAEMEFPLYPYLIAITYKVFGVHDYFGRIWSFLFSMLTLFVFFKLSREYLSNYSLLLALAFFAFNPLIIEFSTAIHSEGLMLLFYITSVYFFLKWLKTEESKDFWLAVFSTALTILTKAPAAHIGLFFAVLLFQKYGFSVFKQAKIWLFGALSLFPAVLWYWHAKNLWKTYGNSLGVSNEYHWIGTDFFTNSYFIQGILRSEFLYVWVTFGLIVGIFAVWRGFNEKGVKHALLWLASAFVFYIIAARTSADEWANYYHLFSIPPAALLFGFGAKKLWEYMQSFANFFSEQTALQKLRKIGVILIVSISIAAAFLLEAKQIRANYKEKLLNDESFACAKKIAHLLKKEGSILVSGGKCFDADGFQTAYNASFMFYWLERKGFNICVEEQSVEKVREFSAKGAKYFLAEKPLLQRKPNFENELKQNFPIVAECEEFFVFDLGN